MALPNFPIGRPRPRGIDPAEDELYAARTLIRQGGSVYEPPEDIEASPYVMPVSVYRTVMADQIAAQGAGLAVAHDGHDLAFNFHLQAETQKLIPGALFNVRKVAPDLDMPDPLGAPRGFGYHAAEVDKELNRVYAELRRHSGAPLTQEEFEVRSNMSPEQEVEQIFSRRLRQYELDVGRAPNEFQVQQLRRDIDQEVRNRRARDESPIKSAWDVPAIAAYGQLQQVAQTIGPVFDGHRFMRFMVTNTVATYETATGRQHSRGDALTSAGERFDELYADLPRPVQLFIDELSVGTAVTTIAGGGLFKLLQASGRSGAVLGRLIEPFTFGPTAFLREAGAGAAIRWVYEDTEGMPTYARLGLAGMAGISTGNPEAVASGLNRTIRASLRSGDAFLRQGGILETAVIGMPMGPGGRAADNAVDPLLRLPTEILPYERPQSALNVIDRGARFTPNAAAPISSSAMTRAAARAGQLDIPVPPGVAHNIQLAEDSAPWDEPGIGLAALIRRVSDIPGMPAGVRDTLRAPLPSQSRVIRVAYAAEARVRSELSARVYPSRELWVHRLRQVFGEDGDLTVEYIGGARRSWIGHATGRSDDYMIDAAEHPYTNTLYDVLTQPDRYSLTPEQRALIAQFDRRNTSVSNVARDEFGVDIGEFGSPTPAQPGGHAFLSIINRADLSGLDIPSRWQAVSGRIRERASNTVDDYIAGLESVDDFDPITRLEDVLRFMDEAKIRAAGAETFNWALGGYNANIWERPAGMSTRQVGDWWLPTADVEELNRLNAEQWLMPPAIRGGLEAVREVFLNGDMSPLTIQGALSWFTAPFTAKVDAIKALGDGRFWRSFDSVDFAGEIAENTDSWIAFARTMGMTVNGVAPDEFSAGIFSRMRFRTPFGTRSLSGVDRLNNRLSLLVTRSAYRRWGEVVSDLTAAGYPLAQAQEAAGNVVSHVIPMLNPARAGIPRAASSELRAGLTSVSFIYQPIDFAMMASRGFFKSAIPTLGEVTPAERMAMNMMMRLHGWVIGLSAITAYETAEERGLTKEQAMQRAVTPGNQDFMRVFVPQEIPGIGGLSAPMGGPYRSLWMSMWGQGDIGERLLSYGTARLNPAIGSPIEIAGNEDFYGQTIRQGGFWTAALRAVTYYGESMLPITVGSLVESLRNDAAPREALQLAVAEFFGISGRTTSPYQAMDQERRRTALALADASAVELEAAGMSPAQASAAVGYKHIDDLASRIGTRAAQAFVEANSGRFGDTYDEYIESLKFRADRGSRTNAALLISANTQRALALAAEELAQNAIIHPDDTEELIPAKEHFRTHVRPDIINQSIGMASVYQDVFDSFGDSDNLIDQLAAQWHELLDEAVVPLGDTGFTYTDYELFNRKEEEFLRKLDAEHGLGTSDLVMGNILIAPRGASPLEVELRGVRRGLETTGYWKLRDEVWAEVAGENIKEYETFDDYRAHIIGVAAGRLLSGVVSLRISRDQAWRIAERASASDPVIKRHDELLINRKAEWAMKQQDAGNGDLVDRAIEWGYLSDSELNLAIALRDQIATGQSGGQPDSPGGGSQGGVPSAPLPPPALPPAPPPPPLPPPRSEDVTREMAELFVQGVSYNQLASRYNTTRGAIEQRLRRHFGGSPLEARAQATL